MKIRFSCNFLLVFGLFLTSIQVSAQTISRPTFSVSTLNTAGLTFCRNEPFMIQFQPQAIPISNVFEVLLSDSAGSFASPTLIGIQQATTEAVQRIRCQIPDTMIPGSAYHLRIRASEENVLSPLNLHPFSVSSTRTPNENHNINGENYWQGHVYTWHSTVNVTEPVANTINFFDSSNYVASFQVENLSFSLEMNNGEISEVTSGVSNFSGCTKGDYFSLRLQRRQYFDSGYYAFRLRGDDGIRFSTDGGATWLLSGWTRQTNAIQCLNNCCGIFMTSGFKDLVFEFFEEGGTATAELVMEKSGTEGTITPPLTLQGAQICASTPAFPIGFLPAGGRYSGIGLTQIGIFEPDSGQAGIRTLNYETGIFGCLQTATVTFNVLPRPQSPSISTIGEPSICEGGRVELFSSTDQGNQWFLNSDTLIGAIDSTFSASLSGAYSALVSDTSGCVSFPSNSVEVLVSAFPVILLQPADAAILAGQGAFFEVEVEAPGIEYQWQIDSLLGFENLVESSSFLGVNSARLEMTQTSAGDHGHQFRCVINRNQCFDTTNAATLSILTSIGHSGKLAKPVLYPNPGNETLRILNSEVALIDFSLFDFTGKLVLRSKNSEALSVKHLPTGVYHWKIEQGQQIFMGKWMKN